MSIVQEIKDLVRERDSAREQAEFRKAVLDTRRQALDELRAERDTLKTRLVEAVAAHTTASAGRAKWRAEAERRRLEWWALLEKRDELLQKRNDWRTQCERRELERRALLEKRDEWIDQRDAALVLVQELETVVEESLKSLDRLPYHPTDRVAGILAEHERLQGAVATERRERHLMEENYKHATAQLEALRRRFDDTTRG